MMEHGLRIVHGRLQPLILDRDLTTHNLAKCSHTERGSKEKQDTCYGDQQTQSNRRHRGAWWWRWRRRDLEVNKDHTSKISSRKGKECDGAGQVVRGDGQKVVKDVEAADGEAEQKQGHIQEGNHRVCFSTQQDIMNRLSENQALGPMD